MRELGKGARLQCHAGRTEEFTLEPEINGKSLRGVSVGKIIPFVIHLCCFQIVSGVNTLVYMSLNSLLAPVTTLDSQSIFSNLISKQREMCVRVRVSRTIRETRKELRMWGAVGSKASRVVTTFS